MKKLLVICLFGIITPLSALEACVDKSPEIILDLGGSSKTEKIIYDTYNACEKSHGWYCGSRGCSLEVLDENGKYGLGYITHNDWYIRPTESVLKKKPTYELVMPLANGNLRVIKVINGKLTAIEVKVTKIEVEN